jgi:ribonuclease HII
LSFQTAKFSSLLAFDQIQIAQYNTSNLFQLTHVVGVDEVGRGSLIGPVVAGACCFYRPLTTAEEESLSNLDDSKATHLNHIKRLALAESLKSCTAWGLGLASLEEIETLNLSQASLLASYRAILALCEAFPAIHLDKGLVLLDGKSRIQSLSSPQKPIIKADAQSACVAAGSVLAKAYRDSWVESVTKQHPHYQWETNMGYPTPAHKKALLTYGISPLHRKTYAPVRQAMILTAEKAV